MSLANTSSTIFALLPPFYKQPPYKDVNVYLHRIEKEFSILIERYSYIKDAFDHDVFIINEEIVFRFPRTQQEKDVLKQEIPFLKMLKRRVDIAIPEYSYISASDDFAGYKFLPGKVLAPWIFKNLSQEEKKIAIKQIIGFINKFSCH